MNVERIPAFSAKRLFVFTPCSAQGSVNDDDTRMHVFTNATATGSLWPSTGDHWSPFTTRMKKYAVKKAPKTITSEMMKSSIPSSCGSTRELRFAGGGP